MEKDKLARIESYILDFFRRDRGNKLLTRTIFDETSLYSNADLVRAFEDLEARQRILIRYTDEGQDWLALTADGARYAGVPNIEALDDLRARPHPPKSATS